ncbi:MAG TPA: metallophosphoesterase [Reyranellaceae bacterium]|nr:metallophosphoesterase [Reyranellaceae bacterium]
MPVIDKERDDQFIRLWRETGGSAAKVAQLLNKTERGVYSRRNELEKRYRIQLPSAGQTEGKGRGDLPPDFYKYNPRHVVSGFSGRMVVFSDCHWWPGISETLAYKALLEVIRELKPKLVIANGDILDGAKISRFPPDGWENRPRMADELEEVKTRMAEIRHAYRGAEPVRTIGNHDTRFDRWLAVNAGEFEGIAGFRLKDHLPAWHECISVFVNDAIVVKHRWHGGAHAAWNNVMKSGLTMVTGHTHALEARPYEDYRGRRFGVQTGSLAEVSAAEGQGPQFAYAEDSPGQGRSGFAVLEVLPGGHLLTPSLCEVVNGAAYFRGQVVVSERKRRAA